MSERDFPDIPIPQLQPGKKRVSWKGYEKSKDRLLELAGRPGVTAREVEEHYGLGKNQIAVWRQNAKNFARQRGEAAEGERPGVTSLSARRREIERALAQKSDDPSGGPHDPETPSVRSVVDELARRRRELLARREEIDREIEGLDGEIREAISALESLMGTGAATPPPRDPLEARSSGDRPNEDGPSSEPSAEG
jgi:transposase-like protein